MKIYVGVTDYDWFSLLKSQKPNEINFWQPNSGRNFRVLQEGELFLFKLHAPRNFIVGGGIFTRQVKLPLSLTWDAFGINNDVRTCDEFRKKINQLGNGERRSEFDPVVSSLILTSPFFLDESHWIPVPASFARNIVQGKTYDTAEEEGQLLYQAIQSNLQFQSEIPTVADRYSNPVLITPRLGQGSFRFIVTDVYHKRCAITGEKTLPVLDAAHIRPYAQDGQDLVVEVSMRLKEDFGNGKAYYAYHG